MSIYAFRRSIRASKDPHKQGPSLSSRLSDSGGNNIYQKSAFRDSSPISEIIFQNHKKITSLSLLSFLFFSFLFIFFFFFFWFLLPRPYPFKWVPVPTTRNLLNQLQVINVQNCRDKLSNLSFNSLPIGVCLLDPEK